MATKSKQGDARKAPQPSRSKAKSKTATGNKTATGKKAAAGAKRAVKSLSKATPTPKSRAAAGAHEPLDDLIAAAAHVLALPIDPAWLPAIRMNLDITLRQAALVSEFALPDDAEPAPVFEA
jgi:hypothetical protein